MKPELQANCPIPATHDRLHQSHRLWHQTLQEYSDPDGFCTNLNATIQALRSITFVLQKEKAAIPDFEQWYEGWRKRMKQDPVMTWLINARNRIEKEGNLSTHSIAKISVLAGWNGPVVMAEQKVNPLTPIEEIVKKTKELRPPRKYGAKGCL